MKDKKGKNKKIATIITAGALVIAIGAGSVYASIRQKNPEGETEAVQQTAVIEKRNLEQTVSISGTMISAESHSVSTDITEAKVESVVKKVGDVVKAGDVIATLDGTEIQKQLENARENLRIANARSGVEVSSAERNYQSAANEAQVQGSRSQNNLDQAKNQYDKTVANANQLNSRYQAGINDVKTKELLENNAYNEWTAAGNAATEKENALNIAQKIAEEKKAALDAAQSAYDAAVSSGDVNAANLKGTLDIAKSEYDQASAAVVSATNDFNTAKQTLVEKETIYNNAKAALADAKSREAELAEAYKQASSAIEPAKDEIKKAEENKSDAERSTGKSLADQKDSVTNSKLSASANANTPEQEVEKYERQLEQCTITAPADGIITTMNIKEGEIYKGGEVAVVQNNESYKASAAVDQYDISDIEKGMAVRIKTVTTGDEEMQGTVSFISPTPKVVTGDKDSAATNGDYEIEASISNPSDRLRIGMNAKLTIILKEKQAVLTVPGNCVQQDENGENYIEVIEGEGQEATTKRIPVAYGLKTDYYVEIIGEGIEENMKVLISADGSAVMGVAE